jgi:hypothetical protein
MDDPRGHRGRNQTDGTPGGGRLVQALFVALGKAAVFKHIPVY